MVMGPAVERHKNMPPLISIITSNYNQGRYLKNLLSCVREQKRERHEFIIADALSSDDSLQIIEAARALVDRLDVASDKGPADGWRRGLELARGEYVMFINADDALLPNALLQIEESIAGHPEVDIFVAHGLIVDERQQTSRMFFTHRPRFARLARGIGNICQQSTIFRRAALASVSINVSNNTCWDAELLIDCLAKGAIAERVSNIWGVFRLTDTSISGRAPTEEKQARYRNDRENISIKHGISPLPELLQSTLARAEKAADPDFYRLLAMRKNFRSVRSMESIWPA
jgi:glycosyltransferase involved in cell wall biosynthesis